MSEGPAGKVRWKRHLGVNAALLLCAAGAVLASVAVLGLLLPANRSGDRVSLAYWAIVLPAAFWGHALTNFSPRALRWMPAVALAMTVIGVALCGRLWWMGTLAGWPLGLAVGAAVTSALAAALAAGPAYRAMLQDLGGTTP